jgi:hypothetical protein
MRRIRLLPLADVAVALLLLGSSSASGQDSLGSAQRFAVLGGSTVTNTGPTTVTGDLGVSPGSAVVGFPPGIVIGVIHAADAVALQAQVDATTAYNALAAMPCDVDLSGQDLGGLTLVPGVYCFSSSAQLTGALTLDALGSDSSTFVFQIGSSLTTASSSSVTVINGGSSCNVFWQVGSSATLGTSTSFVGNVLASASITLTTSSNVSGRLLALNGAVTMDSNSITLCCTASWANYGAGSSGTLGVPGFVASNPPVIGGAITATIGNSSPNDSFGLMLVGLGEASIPMCGGTILVAPPWIMYQVFLPVGGLDLSGTFPLDWALCGFELDLQVIEFDAGGTNGLSFTPGLTFMLGT